MEEAGMMTTTLRAALIFVSLGTCCLIMRKIRQSKMQIESAIFWIVLSLVLVVYSPVSYTHLTLPTTERV